MARLSPLYPRSPVDVAERLSTLPQDGSVPFLDEWQWVHTPGHSPGHVSLWRPRDRVLVSGDAVVTTRQESAYAALFHPPEVHGPPAYFTPDWTAAAASVRHLAQLEPELLVSHHGAALSGPQMRHALHRLAEHFEEIATPGGGT